MLISRLKLKNWRNFKNADVALRERAYIIGPNASGKSNLLDVFRFLRDVARPDGGGLQKGVKDRGGIAKLRCVLARKDPEVLIEVDIAEGVDEEPAWRYTLAFKGEAKGLHRVPVSQERVEDLRTKKVLVNRPDSEDRKDRDRLTQSCLEQIGTNRRFRDVASFLASISGCSGWFSRPPARHLNPCGGGSGACPNVWSCS
jgi:predicted ATPase